MGIRRLGTQHMRNLLRLVKRYYRASRGTLAQRGVDVPVPRRLVDTVLRHAGDARYSVRVRHGLHRARHHLSPLTHPTARIPPGHGPPTRAPNPPW